MIYVIVPLGQQAKDVRLWLARVVVYVLASALGGALLGLLLALLGKPLRLLFFGREAIPVALLAVTALLYALHEVGVLRLPAPQSNWQVPNSWGVNYPLVGTFFYGLALGAGVFTFIPFAGFYLLLGWELLAASLKVGLLLGALYGLVRGLPAMLGGIITFRNASLIDFNDWVLDRQRDLLQASSFLLAMLGSYLLLSLLHL